jgi:hypothetical protein
VPSPNLLQVVLIPHAHLPCRGYAIAPIISSARPETDPSSRMASLVAENTHPRGQPTRQRPSAPPNTFSKASNSVGEDSALRLLASLAR